jgi:hypothetical protein
MSFLEKANGSFVIILFIASDRTELSVLFLHPSQRQLYIELHMYLIAHLALRKTFAVHLQTHALPAVAGFLLRRSLNF